MSNVRVIVKPLSRHFIRYFTNHIRKTFKLKSPYFPIVEFIEMYASIDDDFNYEIVPVEKLNEYALTIPTEKLIKIREDVYIDAVNGIPRHRYTLAHELGHVFLHTPERILLARAPSPNDIPYAERPEWQANTFAGELLAPADMVNTFYDEAAIAETFGVSLAVARIQLNEAKKAS